MAGGAAGFGYYLYMRQYWFPNPYKTQGVQNIEDRFSAAGGHPTHTPGTATKMGTISILKNSMLESRLTSLQVQQTTHQDKKAVTRAQIPSIINKTFQNSMMIMYVTQ